MEACDVQKRLVAPISSSSCRFLGARRLGLCLPLATNRLGHLKQSLNTFLLFSLPSVKSGKNSLPSSHYSGLDENMFAKAFNQLK